MEVDCGGREKAPAPHVTKPTNDTQNKITEFGKKVPNIIHMGHFDFGKKTRDDVAFKFENFTKYYTPIAFRLCRLRRTSILDHKIIAV